RRPRLMNQCIRGSLGHSGAAEGDVILEIEGAQNGGRNVGDSAESTRQMIVTEDRGSVAATGAELVLCDLLYAGSLATRRLDLLGGGTLGQGIHIQPGIRAVQLRTDGR